MNLKNMFLIKSIAKLQKARKNLYFLTVNRGEAVLRLNFATLSIIFLVLFFNKTDIYANKASKPKKNYLKKKSIAKKKKISNIKSKKKSVSKKNIKNQSKKRFTYKEMDEQKLKDIKKAWIKSMILPGLGQKQNGKVWKSGVIWLGFGGMLGGAFYAHKRYKEIEFGRPKKEVKYRIWRNGLLVASFFWYALNILDAYVDAHMSTFDISKNLLPNKFPGKEKQNSFKKMRQRKKQLSNKKR